MEEVNRVDGRIDKLEERFDKLEGHLHDTDLKLEKNNVLTEQNTKMMERLGDTLENVSNTMQEISFVTKTLVWDVDDIKTGMGETNKRIDEIKCDENVNITKFIKDNFIQIILWVSVVGYIVLGKVVVL